MATMQAVAKTTPGPGMQLIEAPIPTPGPHDVLIQVRAASICGTDLHIYHWDAWSQRRIQPPLIIGHEFAGIVVQVGEDVRPDQVQVGDHVSAESHLTCGTCRPCQLGRRHVCEHTRIIGVDADGAYAQYVAMPAENVWRNPPDMPWAVASLQENFGNSVHTVAACDVRAKRVLLTGCGPAGLMAIPVARAFGAQCIIATDLSPYRLDLARQVGADLALNPAQDDVPARVRDLVGPGGVDVLLEMSGAPAALTQGLQLLAPGGEAALLGLPPALVDGFDLANLVIMRGIQVHGVVGRRVWETWHQMRSLISSGRVDLQPIITHEFPLSRWEEGLRVMGSGQSGKIVLYPDA